MKNFNMYVGILLVTMITGNCFGANLDKPSTDPNANKSVPVQLGSSTPNVTPMYPDLVPDQNKPSTDSQKSALEQAEDLEKKLRSAWGEKAQGEVKDEFEKKQSTVQPNNTANKFMQWAFVQQFNEYTETVRKAFKNSFNQYNQPGNRALGVGIIAVGIASYFINKIVWPACLAASTGAFAEHVKHELCFCASLETGKKAWYTPLATGKNKPLCEGFTSGLMYGGLYWLLTRLGPAPVIKLSLLAGQTGYTVFSHPDFREHALYYMGKVPMVGPILGTKQAPSKSLKEVAVPFGLHVCCFLAGAAGPLALAGKA